MSAFRCIPMATEVAERFRSSGRDDSGNVLKRMISPGSFPCRHCLAEASAGADVLLGSYDLVGPRGIYWTPSPIFVHDIACERFAEVDAVPPIVRNRLVSVRAYDADDMCLYDLGQVSEGDDVDASLARALDDGRTRFVNIHTAKPGCLLCRVERV